MSKGYPDQTEITNEKLIEWSDPTTGKIKVYIAGNPGGFLENREIEFGGRKDAQVKIRGILTCDYPIFPEVGPRAVTTTPVKQIAALGSISIKAMQSLRNKENDYCLDKHVRSTMG